MKKRELRPICSMGMFDLLKGVHIFLSPIFHTALLSSFEVKFPYFAPVFSGIANFILYAVVIAAGFAIRKRTIKKCLSQLKRTLLVPFLVTGFITAFLYGMNHYFLYSTYDSIKEGLLTLSGYFLGRPQTIICGIYGDFTRYFIGPSWFLFALAGAWFLLNLILHVSKKWAQNLLVLFCVLIGHYGLLHAPKYNIQYPFCFFYMFKLVLGLYIGFLAREHKWFEKKLSPLAIILLVASIAGFAWKYQTPYVVASAIANPLDFFTPFAAAAVGFGIVYFFTHINRRENAVTNFFEAIGQKSIYYYCVHTIEYIAVPWYWFKFSIPEATDKHIFCMVLILRVAFIIFGMLIIKYFQEWGGFARIKEKLFRKKTA